MSIPDYQSLMRPVLQHAEKGEVRIRHFVEVLANEFALTSEERNEMLASGKQSVFANRVHWAKTYLKQAGLVEATRRGYFTITDRGKAALADSAQSIDNAFLKQFDEFIAFQERSAVKHEKEIDGGVKRKTLPPMKLSAQLIRKSMTVWLLNY